jgi:exo-1,4-beta-D-glucosaminidase
MRTVVSHVLGLVAVAAWFGAAGVHAEMRFAPTPIDQGAGHAAAIGQWQIQSTAKAQQGGAEVSANGFPTRDWYRVSGRATVMAGLVENGLYKDVFNGDNLRGVQVPDANSGRFEVPWWYRTQFTLDRGGADRHAFVRTNGVIGGADIWLNGHQVVARSATQGAYPVHLLDVTDWLQTGTNTLAMKVHPANIWRDLVIGWVDWNPAPPDNNMGPWRGVDIVTTGAVMLGAPAVTSELLADHKTAALTVRISVQNLESTPRKVTVAGQVAGIALSRALELAPNDTQSIVFTPATDPALKLANPKLWWPAGMGAQPLYQLALTAMVGDQVSDRASATFGVRSVTSRLTRQGYRQFLVNGVPVLIRGGGWAPDMFLREDPARMDAEFSYVKNLGLNTIRLEGKLEDQRFYDLADRDGIMVLAGWECCDMWEAWSGTGGEPWDAADMQVARASMQSEARLLRNHPSVIGFLIGSDNAPPPEIATMYVDTLHAEHWPNPIIAAAADRKTAVTGPSGMKMSGPYDWVPPNYWYGDQVGGAFGFNGETSAGADIPRLGDVQQMLTPLDQLALWKYPAVKQYHAAAFWSPFSSLEAFDTALAKRYGAPKDLADYVGKAQLANYDNVRAQFEAYSAHMDAANPSTGVIYWMLNNAWPSLHWHLYDYYLNPAGAYFGAKKANEPVHIQYAYDTRAIVLVNHTLTDEHGLQAIIRVRNLDGSVRHEQHLQGIDLAGNHTRQLTRLPEPAGLSRTYFVELALASADGMTVSRNVYWLSTQTDQLDWVQSNWYLTPVTKYADLSALQSLPVAASEVRATVRHDGAEDIATVTLTVPATSRTVALFQHVSINRATDGSPVLPILWSDNDITLWPGQSLTLTAHYAAQGAATPVVQVSGWNVPARSVPITVGESPDAARGTSD